MSEPSHAHQQPSGFCRRFGPWGLVLGASEGLGLALADSLAARGLDLVITGRRPEVLAAAAGSLAARHGRTVRPLVCDLASPDAMDRLTAGCAGLEIGCLVYNAALAPNTPFLELSPAALDQLARVNLSGVMQAIRLFGAPMAGRQRGGILLMSSLASLQGSGWLAGYAASKSFIRVLGEGLWAELALRGVRVLTCLAGATATPNFRSSGFSASAPAFPPVQSPAQVAAAALHALEHRRGPVVISGFWNRLSAACLGLLPRTIAIRIMSATARKAMESA